MNARVKKVLLLGLAAALLVGSGQMQKLLNRDRAKLDLTRMAPLKNAPPLLAFTTVALGGFRGLISNFLWIRANQLQQADKYFEMVQLANWITDLEPHFPQVWAFQAWNMAWNISVNFKNFADRWRWVQRGIHLLRDDGLRYNPNSMLLYFNLSWIFQSKMGQNMDDANVYYKEHWAKDMTPFFGPEGTNITELLHPETPKAKALVKVFRDKYKMNPEFVQKVNEQWGPLDWRLPEASAIYWAALGMQKAKEHPGKVDKSDVMKLRRSIYQSMLQAFYHGRLVINPFDKSFNVYPNLDLVSKVNDAYVTSYAQEKDPGEKNSISHAHWNFLRDAVYFLYLDDRIGEATKWFHYLARQYPNKPIIDNDTNSLPANVTLDQYAVSCVQGDINDSGQDRTTSVVEGLLKNAYYQLAVGHDARYAGFKLLASKVYEYYEKKNSYPGGLKRVGLPPFANMNRVVLDDLLSPKSGLSYAGRAALRSQLRMPPETVSTNAAPSETLSTNATGVVNTNLLNSIGK